MKKTRKNTLVLTILGLLFSSSLVLAQEKASPPATATGKVGAATLKISYSSPSVKGRKIWGDLVPYGKAWRAGANEATIFETDKAVTVEGKPLPAGKYSLFAIPGETSWTIILNSETGQWGIKQGGAANYDKAKDVVSVNVKPVKSSSMNEKLVYDINSKGFSLKWENLEVPVAVK